MKWLVAVAALAILTSPAAAGPPTMDGAHALQELLEGNQRYSQNRPETSASGALQRFQSSVARQPLAAVLACSDFRLAVETVFDQPPGALSVVRLAGNVADQTALESLSWAVLRHNVRLVLVLGHDRCAAVTAAVISRPMFQNDYPAVFHELRAAMIESSQMKGDPVDNAIDANIRHVVETVKHFKPLQSLINSGELAVMGGRYYAASGKVVLITELGNSGGFGIPGKP